MNSYKIICQIDGRVIASLSMDGTMTVHHDHFKDEDNFEVVRFIQAIDEFAYRRNIQHLSKRGLNLATVEQINRVQEQKPGKIRFGPVPDYTAGVPIK